VRWAAEGAETAAALPKPKVKFAGLTQHSQADTQQFDRKSL
jgi:hypothetical protein